MPRSDVAARLADYRPGSIENVGEHDDYLDWFVDSQIRLRKAVDNIGGLTILRDQV